MTGPSETVIWLVVDCPTALNCEDLDIGSIFPAAACRPTARRQEAAMPLIIRNSDFMSRRSLLYPWIRSTRRFTLVLPQRWPILGMSGSKSVHMNTFRPNMRNTV